MFKCKEILNNKQTILYPTDTVWGIGCDATSEKAVQEIYRLKQRNESKALIILVSSIDMLKNYVEVSEKVIEILKNVKKPTTIIYKNPKGLAKNLINSEDNTVAIRVVNDKFCNELIEKFGKPIVSTSANISGRPTPKSFSEIENEILTGVDYVVNLQTDEIRTKSSTILKIEDDKVLILRE